MRVLLTIVVALAASLSGCWTESRSVRTTTTPVGRRSLPDGPPFVAVTLEHGSDGARAKVTIARSCIPLETVEERSVGVRDKSVTAWGYLGPLALVGLGAAATIQPGSGNDQSALPITAAIAGGLYVLFFARSGIEETPLPTRRRQVVGEPFLCQVQPARDVAVTVRTSTGELEGRTDASGLARLEGDIDLSDPIEVLVDGQPVTKVERRGTPRRQPPKPRPGPPSPLPLPPPPPAPTPRVRGDLGRMEDRELATPRRRGARLNGLARPSKVYVVAEERRHSATVCARSVQPECRSV